MMSLFWQPELDLFFDLNALGKGTGLFAEAVFNCDAHGPMCGGGSATNSIRSGEELIGFKSTFTKAMVVIVSHGITCSILAEVVCKCLGIRLNRLHSFASALVYASALVLIHTAALEYALAPYIKRPAHNCASPYGLLVSVVIGPAFVHATVCGLFALKPNSSFDCSGMEQMISSSLQVISGVSGLETTGFSVIAHVAQRNRDGSITKGAIVSG